MFQCLAQPRPPQSHHPYDRDHAGHCSDNSNDRQQKGDVASRLRRSPGGKRQVVQHDQVSRDPLRGEWVAADKNRPMTLDNNFKFTSLIARPEQSIRCIGLAGKILGHMAAPEQYSAFRIAKPDCQHTFI
jgi:hypothetical protein